MTTLRILQAGLRSTVQDSGRSGHLREAVPPAGPADAFAFAAAQRLVGNDLSDAGIELVGLPFGFVLDAPRLIAATGPDVVVRARGVVSAWTSAFARAGEEISVEGSARFAYLAVSGGIAVEPRLGSRATYVPAGIGPIPRPLTARDELPVGASRWGAERAGCHALPPPRGGPVRVIRGPHADRFADPDAFVTGAYRVSDRSDRQGVRLEGPRPVWTEGEILSIAVVAGAVQVPHGGDPIVLLADHQTTGGYPVIATVIQADLGRVAQAAPDEELSFYEVRREEAVEALRAERRWLDAIR